ncbi:SDR family oxidoreductase [butyrate-producing bacterium]|nr:SDR family oxidoreductase [butyrate-producing bacterium]
MAKPMLPHFGDPVEIGYMMLFLLSGASTYLTGQDFPVDGGAIPHGF